MEMHRETPLGETWWDPWAASYDAPRWDAKEKKPARFLCARNLLEALGGLRRDSPPPACTGKKQTETRIEGGFDPGFSFAGSCELVGAAEFEIIAARVHPVAACGRRRDDLQRNRPLQVVASSTAGSYRMYAGS